jgi:hypothetical protein
LDFFTIYSAFNTFLLSKLLYPGFINLQAFINLLKKLLERKLFRKKFDHKPFQKRLERKPRATAWSSGATLGDKPAQQFRHAFWI